MTAVTTWRTSKATWWDRLFAQLIDSVAVYLPLGYVALNLTLYAPGLSWGVLVCNYLGLVVKLIGEACWGATPGKWLMRVRLVSGEDSISVIRVLLRNVILIALTILNGYSLLLYFQSPYSPYVENVSEHVALSVAVTPLFIVVVQRMLAGIYVLDCAYAMVNSESLPLHDLLLGIQCQKRERRMRGSKRATVAETEAINWAGIGSDESERSPGATDEQPSGTIEERGAPRKRKRDSGPALLYMVLIVACLWGFIVGVYFPLGGFVTPRESAEAQLAERVGVRKDKAEALQRAREEALESALSTLRQKTEASRSAERYESRIPHSPSRRAKLRLNASTYQGNVPIRVLYAVSSVDPSDHVVLLRNGDETPVSRFNVSGSVGVVSIQAVPDGEYAIHFQTKLQNGDWETLVASDSFVVRDATGEESIDSTFTSLSPKIRVDRTRLDLERSLLVEFEDLPAAHEVQYAFVPFQLPFGQEPEESIETLSESNGTFDYQLDPIQYERKRLGQMELRFYFFDRISDRSPRPEIIVPCSVLAQNYRDFEVETYQSVFKVGQEIPIAISDKYGALSSDSYLMLVNQDLRHRPVVQLTRKVVGVKPGLYEVQFVRGPADAAMLAGWTRVRVEENEPSGGGEAQ